LGPLKDFECSCGIRQRPNQQESKQIFDHLQTKRKFCSVCDVEYTWSVIRRYQLGYIRLISPVTHLWYLRANPSYLSILLDMKRKKLENLIYCIETSTIENNWKSSHTFGFENSPAFLYLSWQQTLEDPNLKNLENITRHQKIKQLRSNIIPKRLDVDGKGLSSNLEFQTKINMKLKKRFISTIWFLVWKALVHQNYSDSIKQNHKIWQILWAKYQMKYGKNAVAPLFDQKFSKKEKNS